MKQALVGLVAISLLGGCATSPSAQGTAQDPWEDLNRKVYGLNEAVDKVTLKPVSKGYQIIIPEPLRKGVGNFSRNLTVPGSMLNNFLQGKPRQGLDELVRFLLNSTIGIGGLVDVATISGIEAHPEDFGQTAAVWGIPSGPYVMLPFLGPRTLRGTFTLPLDILADPLYHYDVSSVRDKVYVLRLIHLRSRLLSLEDLLKDSKDPYVTVRESYLQNRDFQIYDGNPPNEEDDEFYDEFLEEEDY